MLDAWLRSGVVAARHAQSGFLQLRGDLQKEIRRLEQQLQRIILQAQREKKKRDSKGKTHKKQQNKDRPPLTQHATTGQQQQQAPQPPQLAQYNPHSDSISRLRGGAATQPAANTSMDDGGESVSPLSDLSSPAPTSGKPALSPPSAVPSSSPMQLSGGSSSGNGNGAVVAIVPVSSPSPSPFPSLASSAHPMWSELLHACQSLQRCADFVIRNYSCMWRGEAAQRLQLQLDPATTAAQHRESAKQMQLSNVDDPLNLADLLVELVEEVQVLAQLAIMVIADAAESYSAPSQPSSQIRANSGSSVELTPQRSPSTNGSEQSVYSMSPSPSAPAIEGGFRLSEQGQRYVQSSRTPSNDARGSSDSSGNSAPPGNLFALAPCGRNDGSKGSSPLLENGQKGHERQSGGGSSTPNVDEAAMTGSTSDQRSITPPSPSVPAADTPMCGICEAHASCCVILSGCSHAFCLACLLTHPSFGSSCPCCPDARPLVLTQCTLSLDAMLFESGVSRWEEASTRSATAATSLAASTEPLSTSDSTTARSSSGDSQTQSQSQSSAASSTFTVSQLVSKLRKHASLSRADDSNASSMMQDESQPSRSGGGSGGRDGKSKGPLVEQMLASSRRREESSPDSQEAQPPQSSDRAHASSSANGSASSSIRSSNKKQQNQQPAEPSSSPSKTAAGVEMSDAPTAAAAPASSPNSLAVLGGFSCHQCKVSKLATQLRFCDNSKNQPTTVPAARGGVKLKKSCNKKYCFTCLERLYNEEPSASQWACPSCRLVCCCANCCRKQGRQTVTAESRQNREAQRAAANAAGNAAKKERASSSSGSASGSGASSSSLTDGSVGSPAQSLRMLSVAGSGSTVAGGLSAAPPPPGTTLLNSTFRYEAMRSHDHTNAVGHRFHSRAQPYGEQPAGSPSAQHGRTSQSTTLQQNKQTAHHEQLLRSRGMMMNEMSSLPPVLLVPSAHATAAVPYPMAPSHALRRGVPPIPSSNSSGSSSHSSHLSSSHSSDSNDPHSIRSMVDNDDRQIQAQQEAIAASLRLQHALSLEDSQQQNTNAAAAAAPHPVQPYDHHHQHQQQQQLHADSLLSPPPSADADCLPALTSDYLAASQIWSSNNSQGSSLAKLREEAMERASVRAAERAHGHRARQAERAALTAAAVHGAMQEGRQQQQLQQQQQEHCGSPDQHVPSSAIVDPRNIINPVISASPPVTVDWRAVQQILSSGSSMRHRDSDRDGGEFTTFEGATSHSHHHHHHPSNLHLRGGDGGGGVNEYWDPQDSSGRAKESGGSGSGSDDSQRIKVHSNSSGERRSASASRSGSGSGSGSDQGMNGDSPPPILSNPPSGGDSDGSRGKSVSPEELHRAQQKLQEKMVAHQREQDGQPPPDPKPKRHHHHASSAQQDMLPPAASTMLGGPADPAGLRTWDPLLSPSLHPHHGHGFGPSQFSSSPPLTTSFFTPFTHSSAMPLMALTGGEGSGAGGQGGMPSLHGGGSDSDKSLGDEGAQRTWRLGGPGATGAAASGVDPLQLGSWSQTAMMRPPAVLPSAHHSSPFGDQCMSDVADPAMVGVSTPVLSSAGALQSSAFNSTLTGVHGAWAPLSASTAPHSSSFQHPHVLSHLTTAAVPSQAAVTVTSSSALDSNSAGATSSATTEQARRNRE